VGSSGGVGNRFGGSRARALPSELYAYRPGRNAQQAVVEVEALVFPGHREVVDADPRNILAGLDPGDGILPPGTLIG
jgi:hypothetical protein